MEVSANVVEMKSVGDLASASFPDLVTAVLSIHL